jgi:hypothetical protein
MAMAQSVEQWMAMPPMPALCEVPVAALPYLPLVVIELDDGQRPERVTADRWTASDTNLISALFPGKPWKKTFLATSG